MSDPIYRSLDEAGWQSQQEEIDSAQYGGKRGWRPKIAPAGSQPATNRIRFLPPHQNMLDAKGRPRPFVHIRTHFSLGPRHNVSAPCLKQWGDNCLACEQRDGMFERVRQIGQATSQEQVQEIERLKKRASDTRPQDRFSGNIVDMQDADRGVQPYHFGPDLAKAFSACFYDDEGKFRDITHPQTGRDIIFTAVKKPKTGDMKVEPNDYPSCRPAEKPTALSKMEWLDDIADLSVYGKRITTEEMKGVIEEGTRIDRTPGPAVGSPLPRTQAPTPTSEPDVPRRKGPGRGRRTPIADNGPTATPADPWAQGRAWLHGKGFTTYKDCTPAELEALKQKEPMKSGQLSCFEHETDPTNEYCQSCKVILPCSTGLVAAGRAK